MTVKAEHLMLLGGIAAFVVTLHWVRQRNLRVKYALSWLGIAILLLITGVFPNIVMDTAHRLNLSYAALVAFITAVILFFFAFSVSISLSRQYWRNLRLTQGMALLEKRIRDLETQKKDDEPKAAPSETKLSDISIQSLPPRSSSKESKKHICNGTPQINLLDQ